MIKKQTSPSYAVVTYTTTVGLLEAFFTCKGLAALHFVAANKARQKIFAPKDFLDTSEINYYTAHLKQQLQAYFSGQKVTFDVPLAIVEGTAFSQSVWAAINSVPYGQTASYGELAASLECTKASRAVAQ